MKQALTSVLMAAVIICAAPAFAAGGGGDGGDGPKYLKLHPAFTVNLATGARARFMRVETQIMSRDQAKLDAAKDHMPALRHELILLFSDTTAEAVKSIEGKERLRREALKAINTVLEKETGEPPIEAVYFTSLVVQ